jgi:hypothetical protein
VRFDWRRSPAMLLLHGSELIERNNFATFRVGGLARKAFDSWLLEGGATWVFVSPTESSRMLALTPYRQAGRPPRLELEVNLSHPLFEGVVTPLHDILPPAEMVLHATVGARYLFYWQNVVGDRAWDRDTTWTELDTWRDIAEGLATGQLRDEDRARLERDALGGMGVDPALGVPLLAPVNGTRLGFFFEAGLGLGWAF